MNGIGADQHNLKQRQKRRLLAILHADIVGYSRLMGQDEDGTHYRVIEMYGDVRDAAQAHSGRLVGTAGDAVLAEFSSVTDALDAAVLIQRQCAERNAGLAAHERLELRIGINLGDVIADRGDIFGDDVNLAQRIQTLADPGGIAVSESVYLQAHRHSQLRFVDRGLKDAKNLPEPIRIYAVELERKRMPVGVRAVRLGVLVIVLALVGSSAVLWGPVILEHGASWFSAQPALSGKPTVAVLPFEDRSPDGSQSWFGDGVTEDVISILGRSPGLFVLSWSTVAPYRNTLVEPEALRQELGVRYIVGGSLRRAADQLQVSVQLTDAQRGVLLWSDRWQDSVSDVFAIQQEVARKVAGTLAARLTGVERARAFEKPTENLDAYDYVLRGRELVRKNTRSANFEARRMFEKAMQLDPDYAAAHVGLGWTLTYDFMFGWTDRPYDRLKRAQGLAEDAIAIDAENAEAHALLAYLLRVQEDFVAAARHIDIALELNPNDAQSLAIKGRVLLRTGHIEEAMERVELAIRLDRNPRPFWLFTLGQAYYFLDRYDDAVALLERYRDHIAEDPAPLVVLAAAYAQLGEHEKAAATADALRRVSPFFSARGFVRSFAPPDQREKLKTGLAKAGLD